ncbi:MaoC family dehydratase [Thalassotalea crassostreae]|uniref:MaoC family dehydratase n=1 Tax=Thalassotalea crassostreae TaxID=1763536 RepID=UPI0008394AA6|nr:MaoC family dehydratase [Thalassotalea crassostreae]
MTERTYVGEIYSQTMTLTIHDIANGATALGDTNPIHFNEQAAIKAGYPGIIASGAHTSGLCGGVLTQKFQDTGTFMGLDCSYRFHRAVLPDQVLTIVWRTNRIEFKKSLSGYLVSLSGKMLDDAGNALITARMKVLLRDD